MSILEGITVTNEELKKFLGIEGHENADKLIASLPALKRATFERMAMLEIELALWEKGLAPRPKGVLID